MSKSAFISNIILVALVLVVGFGSMACADDELVPALVEPLSTESEASIEILVEQVPEETTPIIIFTDELPDELIFSETTDINELEVLIVACDEMREASEHIIEVDKGLQEGVRHPLIDQAEEQLRRAESYKVIYQNRIEELKRMEDEYPIASAVWVYLKAQGYNDWVCAGIIGNMMNEAGGNTLNLNVNALSAHKSYFGICQWGKHYKAVWGRDLNGQLDFLMETIEVELNEFGHCYARGFNYSEFINLTDEREAALAFSKCYERNTPASRKARQKNATAAYNYFVGE